MKPASMRGLWVFVSLVVLLSCAATSSGGEEVLTPRLPTIDAVFKGVVQMSPEGFLEERFLIREELASQLMTTRTGESLRLVNWPVSPGDHRTLTVTRTPVYAAGARILEFGDRGVREVPRSNHLHFVGGIEGEDGSGVLLILDPSSDDLTGLTLSGGLSYDLEPLKDENPFGYRLVATHEKTAGSDPHWVCGDEDYVNRATPLGGSAAPKNEAYMKSSGPLEAVLAVDTDSELLSQKFGGSTSAAADYIANLVAAMNVMYTRDLGVTLLQGTTFLRTASDPYDADSGGAASTGELLEFRSYWSLNYASVHRAVAAMLSGKSPWSNSASGIAFIGGLCSTSNGYSYSKVFKISYLSGDALLVGHEIGHNFGSPHTHCYSPPIDSCWNECGVTGATSCPGGPGTVMSYCHLIGCGSNLLEFHFRVIDTILSSHVAPATGVCIFESAPAGGIFSDDFESGGTGAWTGSSS